MARVSARMRTNPEMQAGIMAGRSRRPGEGGRGPRSYVPFTWQAIGNNMLSPMCSTKMVRFETDGPGLGFVDIYTSTGQLLPASRTR